MTIVPVLMAAIAPGIALLSYFYLKDKYETEPIHLVAKMFLLGMLLVLPAMVIQHGVGYEFGNGNFVLSFVSSAGLEESLKWFVLVQLIYRHASFDEPYDGIVYATAVSLGFATLENVFYAFLGLPSFAALLYRAFLPVSGHALFGVMMGYYLGKAKFKPEKAGLYLTLSLALPIVWHGVFDYILLLSNWIWLMVPLMGYLWIRSLGRISRANDRSPLRALGSEEEIKA
ncbi:peptidase [Gordoniibacillus kamchatkensis]|uniref:Protease PrsW n=1 Tax=Gordoniibacillus kamchatkensis TaxID=1590651 RepID=A0ABR5AL42_9BACL|nr:glutamic-type intramembrane protease PrsW [Paenibacillus sp. VKM B-2647]KIL41588.1 peptidase [Paenibacillus sp. VKM B-2647]